MKTIAVLSRKGGTGKTTVSLHLAVAAWLQDRNVILIDGDRQGSAREWRRERTAGGPVVLASKSAALFATQQSAQRAGYELMIIDTGPNGNEELASAVRCADYCLMVVRPSAFDVRAIRETAELVIRFGKPGAFLINQGPPRRGGKEAACIGETVSALAALGRPLLPTGLRSRISYQQAISAGLSVQEFSQAGLAAREIAALWRALEGEVDLAGGAGRLTGAQPYDRGARGKEGETGAVRRHR